ncbi:MAG: hypothetical protein ABIQ31_07860 [Ferruginibacter sp.]
MNTNLPFLAMGAVVAIIIFAAMRNNQGRRNDKRTERLEKRQEELLDLLKERNPSTENTKGI